MFCKNALGNIGSDQTREEFYDKMQHVLNYKCKDMYLLPKSYQNRYLEVFGKGSKNNEIKYE